MQSNCTSEQELRLILRSLILESVKTAQEKIKNEDGIFYVDFVREMTPKVQELRKNGMSFENLVVDRLFTFLFMSEDAFLCNGDYTQFSAVELPGFNKWSTFHKERFSGYNLDPETMIFTPKRVPTLNYDMLMKLFKST